MSTLASRLQVNSVTTLTGDDDGFGPASSDYLFPFSEGLLTNGTGAGQANKFYKDKLTIPASGSQTINLGDGSLTDPQGNSVDFSRLAKFVVYNANTVDGDDLLVGDAAVNPWEGWTTEAGATLTIGPGGLRVFYEPGADGMPVNGSNSSQVLFTNLNTSHALTVYVSAEGS